ncbi:hypothetical protein MA16_Dca011405 [Dendrobium catenatum]|uniref:Uncharacterized protein n=1 Tax=Dendrobium catenatum TaxID=906689 RepID=A0A2I0WP08_9ASPA|nr:hypothetical protein MA16_Dca011405 [Dendrobium catenatum]
MGFNQGFEALLEGSNHNLSYQTVSDFNELILKSNGSTRRIQRAQDRKIPISLRPSNVQRTVHNRRVQHQPSIRPAPDLTPIYKPCHSRKTINRALILHKRTQVKREKKKGRRRERGKGESSPPRPPSELFPPPEYAGMLTSILPGHGHGGLS